jgi:hypothetical protein
VTGNDIERHRATSSDVVATVVFALLAAAGCADAEPEPIAFDPVRNSGTEAIPGPDEVVPAIGVCVLLGERLERLASVGYTDAELRNLGDVTAVGVDSDDPAVAAAAGDLHEVIVEVLTARRNDPGASPDAFVDAVPALVEACGVLGVEITPADAAHP